MTDITEIPAKDGKLYVSAVFDCYDLGVLGLAMADSMKAELCVSKIKNAYKARSPLLTGPLSIVTVEASIQAHSTGRSLADTELCRV